MISTIARFSQEDVYRGDGLNLYAFCGSNAVMYVDPSGYVGEANTPVIEMSYAEVKEELNVIYKEFVIKKRNNVPSVSNSLLLTELAYGKYSSLPRKTGDNLTGHHMPANDYMKKNTNISMGKSWAMNLEQPESAGRHRRTFTYGLKSDSRGKQFYDVLTPRDALAFDLYDVKRILIEDKVYDAYARKQLKNYIKKYTSNKNFKEIFDKNSKYNKKSKCNK